MAHQRLDLMPNNPVLGLNAIGGAVCIDMKNGFHYHGEDCVCERRRYSR
jgi:iron complex outermembrane recepter protein